MDFLSKALNLLAAGLLVAAVLLLRKKNKKYPPVAGSVLHQLINAPKLHHYMTKLACKYRTYRMLNLLKYAIYTVDPANVEHIHKTNFANYGKHLSDVLGDGIFTVDGSNWLHQRKASSSQLSTSVLRTFSSEIFKTNAVQLADMICEAVTSDEMIEIQDLFMKSTLDSIVKILLGIDLGTLSGTNNEESIQFSDAFNAANEATLYRLADIFWKIKRFLNIGREAALKNNLKVVDQFIYKLIKSKIEAAHSSKDDVSLKKRDFILRLLETTDTDPKYLRDMILCITAAGKDTTAATLSWFLYRMCKHLPIQEKIAQEVRKATNLNNSSSADEVAAKLTEESLKKMQYLLAALSETLRLHPTIPMFLWGDDAEEFRPERWFDVKGVFQEESPFKFIAFNAGPRICLGKEYSYMQMKIFATVLLNRYIFKLSDEEKIVKYRPMITPHIYEGLYVHAYPRLA